MAYQPFPPPTGGSLSEGTTGVTPVTLATAGVDYLVLSVAFNSAAKAPSAPGFIILAESISMMTTSGRDVEFRFIANGVLAGNPLVYSSLGPFSVLEGAVGDGTQEVSNGLVTGIGRYIPGNEERVIDRLPSASMELPAVIPKSLVGMLVARPLANNATVVARWMFRELEVDETGQPVQP